MLRLERGHDAHQRPVAYFGHRDHQDRFIVIIPIGHRDRSEATLGWWLLLDAFLLPPGWPLQGKAMSIMEDALTDRIRDRRVAEMVVPLRSWELAGHDC